MGVNAVLAPAGSLCGVMSLSLNSAGGLGCLGRTW